MLHNKKLCLRHKDFTHSKPSKLLRLTRTMQANDDDVNQPLNRANTHLFNAVTALGEDAVVAALQEDEAHYAGCSGGQQYADLINHLLESANLTIDDVDFVLSLDVAPEEEWHIDALNSVTRCMRRLLGLPAE